MPSPFPGMDPYIELAEVWSDFHSGLADELRAELNRVLQPRYVARLTPRVTYEVVEVDERRSVRPDVAVWRSPAPTGPATGATGVITVAPVESRVEMELPLRLHTVEVRETGTLRLVTAIEILSPVNQRPDHQAYDDYLRMRRELLRSDAHFMEIDLLRGGERPPLQRPVPAAPYYVTPSRAGRRPYVEVWPLLLREPLPVLPAPLLHPDPDVPLPLGSAVSAVYDRGAYSRLIDYRNPPPPPVLSAPDALWVEECLRAQRTG